MTCCTPDQLCELCRDGLWMQLRGTAANRGERWADELALKRRAPWIPWPTDNARVKAVAIELIADLARDVRLRELLAAELESWAAKRWNANSYSVP